MGSQGQCHLGRLVYQFSVIEVVGFHLAKNLKLASLLCCCTEANFLPLLSDYSWMNVDAFCQLLP